MADTAQATSCEEQTGTRARPQKHRRAYPSSSDVQCLGIEVGELDSKLEPMLSCVSP